MMKFSKIFSLVVIILLALLLAAPAVLAQDPTQSPVPTPISEQPPTFELPDKLPATAQEGLQQAALLLIATGGIIASRAAESVKKIKWLKPAEQENITGWVAFLITGLFSILAGVIVDRGMEYASGVDSSGLWKLIITIGPWVFAEIRYRAIAFNKPA